MEEFSQKLEVVKRGFDDQRHSSPYSEVDHDGERGQVTDTSVFGFSKLKLVTKEPYLYGI